MHNKQMKIYIMSIRKNKVVMQKKGGGMKGIKHTVNESIIVKKQE